MKYLVIKCGGSVLEQLPDSFYQNLIQLQKEGIWMPILVHGGGPLISSLLKIQGIETKFINGLRVTTNQVLDVVEMVLSGMVNKLIVRKLIQAKGNPLGLSGVDGQLLISEATKDSHLLGFVGEVTNVNVSLIENIIKKGYLPVISPLGIDRDGQRYNINGDVASAAIAKALGAQLCFISDIPGIYLQEGDEKVVFNQLTKKEAENLISQGVITGGMIPKVSAALDGLIHDVPEVAIINGMQENSLLSFCQGEQIGTRIVLEKEFSYV